MDASSGAGRGAEENRVIKEGQTFVIKTSTSCEDDAEDCIVASDL